MFDFPFHLGKRLETRRLPVIQTDDVIPLTGLKGFTDLAGLQGSQGALDRRHQFTLPDETQAAASNRLSAVGMAGRELRKITALN